MAIVKKFDSEAVERSMKMAALLDERVGKAKVPGRTGRVSVPVRSAFVVSTTDAPPAMTDLLRGGRGGEVKLKVLLSMLWIAVAEPYDVTQSARVWAELIGLPDPEKAGAARVSAAIRRLVEGGYLSSVRRPGRPTQLILREETGTGEPYTHPGSHWEKGGKHERKGDERARYLQVPKELWTNGWIAVLSGPAVAMYLALLEQTRGAKYDNVWFSPAVADRRYGLTEVTRRKGLTQLLEFDLIELHRQAVGRGTLNTIRFRNTYSVDPLALIVLNPNIKEVPLKA